jgi:hypothetical protein
MPYSTSIRMKTQTGPTRARGWSVLLFTISTERLRHVNLGNALAGKGHLKKEIAKLGKRVELESGICPDPIGLELYRDPARLRAALPGSSHKSAQGTAQIGYTVIAFEKGV